MSSPAPPSLFAALFVRDLRLALRRRTEALLPIGFFVVAVALFPLGVGPSETVHPHRPRTCRRPRDTRRRSRTSRR